LRAEDGWLSAPPTAALKIPGYVTRVRSRDFWVRELRHGSAFGHTIEYGFDRRFELLCLDDQDGWIWPWPERLLAVMETELRALIGAEFGPPRVVVDLRRRPREVPGAASPLTQDARRGDAAQLGQP
jgi:hypothetical protein